MNNAAKTNRNSTHRSRYTYPAYLQSETRGYFPEMDEAKVLNTQHPIPRADASIIVRQSLVDLQADAGCCRSAIMKICRQSLWLAWYNRFGSW